MVFCDVCSHRDGAGQVFTLQEKETRQWASVHTESPWVGRQGPLFTVFVPFLETTLFGKQTFTHSISPETSLMGQTPTWCPWKQG